MATANQLPPFALPNTLNLPQADFDLIEQGAKELGKIRNHPAFVQGQAILDAINQLGAHIDTKVTQSQPYHSIDQSADSLVNSSTSSMHVSIHRSLRITTMSLNRSTS